MCPSTALLENEVIQQLTHSQLYVFENLYHLRFLSLLVDLLNTLQKSILLITGHLIQ